MTCWMLDDGPLGILAQECHPSWRWRAPSFHLAEAVASGAALDQSGRRQNLLALEVDQERVVETHAVVAGSDVELQEHDVPRPDRVLSRLDKAFAISPEIPFDNA